eukprot:2492986-Karenia_brevis.AAC.1
MALNVDKCNDGIIQRCQLSDVLCPCNYHGDFNMVTYVCLQWSLLYIQRSDHRPQDHDGC